MRVVALLAVAAVAALMGGAGVNGERHVQHQQHPQLQETALQPAPSPAIRMMAPMFLRRKEHAQRQRQRHHQPDESSAVLLAAAEEVRSSKPRDRLNRDRAAASAQSRAAAIRHSRAAAAHKRKAAPAAPILNRPANAPHAPRPPVPSRRISARNLVRGDGRRYRHGHPMAARPHPKAAASPVAAAGPRFVATLGQANANAKAGAKAKDFVWTEEGQWHGLTAGEDDDELQPPWVDGPDPLPKKVAEPFTPPKAPTMGFQGDGRFYPPPPPPPPPPPSPYPPPPPPPPPGGGVDTGPEEGGDEFLEKAANTHAAAHPTSTPTPTWAHGRDPVSGRPNWIPEAEKLQANTPQYPFNLFPAPPGGNPKQLTNLNAPPPTAATATAPTTATPAATSPVTAASSTHAAAAASPAAGASAASFDPNFHPSAAAPAPAPPTHAAARGPGFGFPSPAPASSSEGDDEFAAFNRNIHAARSGGSIAHRLQDEDAERLKAQAFAEEMAVGAAQEDQRLAELAAQQQHLMMQQHLRMQQLQEPVSAASSDGAMPVPMSAFGPAEPFPDHAMSIPPSP